MANKRRTSIFSGNIRKNISFSCSCKKKGREEQWGKQCAEWRVVERAAALNVIYPKHRNNYVTLSFGFFTSVKKNCCFSRSTSHRMRKHATVDVGVIYDIDSELFEFLRVLRYGILVELLYFGLLIHCWYEIILESINLRMMMIMILLDLSVFFVIECC